MRAPDAAQRAALAAWCAADPGPILHSASPWVPALRSSVKNAAPRPGHEVTALQPNSRANSACQLSKAGAAYRGPFDPAADGLVRAHTNIFIKNNGGNS